MTNTNEIEFDASGPLFSATSITDAEVRTVSLAGELDLHSGPQAMAAFSGASGLPIVVDMTNLVFMDCGGYRAVATARRTAEQAGSAFTISYAHDEPARLLGLLDESGSL